jgi:hypothetical protein
MATRDKVSIVMLVFCVSVGWTIEGFWLFHHNSMEQAHGILRDLLATYWPADRTFREPGYPVEKCFTLALEHMNVFVTQPLGLWLIYAIATGKRYRYVLQLIVATYTSYGTFLYCYVAHLSGYQVFAYRGGYPMFLFYAANAPWIVIYAWLIYDASRHLISHAGQVPPRTISQAT